MDTSKQKGDKNESGAHGSQIHPPSINLPKGGGAIRGIGEKFAANPVTGTGSMSVPIATSPGRSGFGPQLSLSYDSGSGNGPFGFGWSLPLPSIARKTDKGLPKYQDGEESDTFILSAAEDLVPVLEKDDSGWKRVTIERSVNGVAYRIQRYRPRIEGLFARIERWTNIESNETHWRSISRDNITTVYGRTTDSRIQDPDAPAGLPRVFSWLICESYDEKGNAIYYEYEKENSKQIELSSAHERNRTDTTRSANRYLKQIKYGNKSPLKHDSDLPREFREDLSERTDWLFEVVFDYDEGHYEELPAEPNAHQFVKAHKDPTRDWQRRQDSFSSYRSGFEVRTYRLCHQVLMFHHFVDELGVDDYLVRSTEFEYEESPFASFIKSVTQSGYKLQNDGTYLKKSLPPLEFEYSKAEIQEQVQEVDAESLENLPQGLDGTLYQWADIDGEGSSGILTEQGGAWFYKRNLSALPVTGDDGKPQVIARFAPTERLGEIPSNKNLVGGRQQLMDLAGDGQLDVVDFDSPTPGFYERTKDEGWNTFTPFESLPNIHWQDPNLKFADLTGDGHADILITEDDALIWYQSLAETGFASSEKIYQALDEEKGPKLLFADVTQSIYLADISGDGLTDLVRIRNGEVCYWPNFGYGRFGAKVTMDNSPHFDAPDQFDQRRIHLADIDGSGVTDIIYFRGDGVYIFLNESGNRWADAEKLKSFPHVDNLPAMMATDLLGNGTACLVWSSPLPGNVRSPMRYIRLMKEKPHLLIRVINNLGGETHLQYAPSTKFYLADKYAGSPWVTRVPFPVHVVEKVETYDRISRNRFVTRYAYHHGYFDGIEREFRGFGLIEQWDTEEYAALTQSQDFPTGDNIKESSNVPPVLTRTWFHTGAYIDRDHISNFFAGLLDANDIGEYYRELSLTDAQAQQLLLDDTVLPDDLTIDEECEACRALKGSMLRQEIYALDGTDKEPHPYTVTEQNFTIRCLQPKADNRHGVFFTHVCEAINYHYERNPTDPRINHAMTLEVDDFGNVLKEVNIGYGRRQPDMNLSAKDQAKQNRSLVTYTENRVTNAIEVADDDYRTPLPCETCIYELTGLSLSQDSSRFSFEEMLNAGLTASAIECEEAPTSGIVQKRLIEHVCTLYRRDDLAGSLMLGEVQRLALPFETYKLTFTPGLLSRLYGTLVDNAMITKGGYVHSEGDANWWIPSGQAFYSSNGTDTPTQELTHAQQHFFLPCRYRDPFGNQMLVDYDCYDLLFTKTTDSMQNIVTAHNDYRVLQPTLVTNPNGNRTEVAIDALGMVAGTAVMGKVTENLGDSLAEFKADLDQGEIDGFLAAPRGPIAAALLGNATTRIIYDVTRFWREPSPDKRPPAFAATLARETHVKDPLPPGGLRIQISFSYSDGFGREVQKKIQTEPGTVIEGGPIITLRWVGSGWTVFNNKGKPVRQYEPFFSTTHEYEFAKVVGVSPILFYDPVERVVATLYPNHTFEKVPFDPWQQETWDVNDTVLQTDPKCDLNVGDFFSRLPDEEYLPTWHGQRLDGAMGPREQAAAKKAEVHDSTPTITHFDTLGRPFLTVAHNRLQQNGGVVDEKYETHTELDIKGNKREVIDSQARIVMRYDYDIISNRDYQASMEAGERWSLNDVVGKPIRAWDSRGHQFRTEYDALRRPTEEYLLKGASQEQLIGRTVYGEAQPNPETCNLRGQVYQVFDQAGMVTNDTYDFKGNLVCGHRRLAIEYKMTLDWLAAVPLEAPVYTSHTRYDALNRPIQLTAPHGDQPGTGINVIQPSYNEANLLEQVNVWLNHDVAPAGLLDTDTANLNAVTDIDYDAKGQRERIEYGNGVTTTYDYDPLTFHLEHLQTLRGTEVLQDLSYTYDPVGNITHIQDNAQQTIYFRNHRVEPSAEYTYDAVYRLIKATGREHLGQTGDQPNTPTAPDAFNHFHIRLDHPGNGDAMGTYVEEYVYDAVGNIMAIQHRGTDPAHPGWTRAYTYNEPSLLEPSKINNRLSYTKVGSGTTEPCTYDAHGNMTTIPHLPLMQWDYRDQLRATAQQVVNNGGTPETTYYVYNATRQRVRKVTERQVAGGQVPTRIKEHIYLSGFEVYREYGGDGSTIGLERETLHVMDDKKRIALVETRTLGNEPDVPQQLIRYQFGNHLGSAILELDAQAQVISYEEYYPYGSTSYQAVRSAVEIPSKRYRYTGKERDEESGLYYQGARYYAPWLGRWASCDPGGLVDGVNLYRYARNDPVLVTDPTGTQGIWDEEQQVCRPEEFGDADVAIMVSGTPSGVAVVPKKRPHPPVPPSASSTSREISAPPAVSPTDYTLYVPQGFLYTQRQEAVREVENPDNPWYVRGGMFVLGSLVTPLALAEEYIVRPTMNIPFVVHNAGIGIGEHIGRAYLWQQQGETGEAVVESLEAIENFSVGFVTLGLVAEPFAARGPSGSVASAAESRMGTTPASETIVIEGSGSAPKVAPNRSTVPLPKPGESYMGTGMRVHQEFPRIVSETNPAAGGKFNVAPGLKGPDLANPTGMNATFAEMKSLWGQQGPMVSQARRWGFDSQTGRYFFYDRETGQVFEGIIQTEKFASGKFRP